MIISVSKFRNCAILIFYFELVKVAFKSENDKGSYHTCRTGLFLTVFLYHDERTIFHIQDCFEMRISNSTQLHTCIMYFAMIFEYLSQISTRFNHFAYFRIFRKYPLHILHQTSTLWPNICNSTNIFRFRNIF